MSEKISLVIKSSRKHILPLSVLSIVQLFVFRYILFGRTLSPIGAHSQGLWPWKAYPTGIKDSIVATDQANSYFPWSVYIAKNIRNGYISFWNQHSFGGNPFSSNGQSSALYPVRLVFSFLFDPAFLHDQMIVFHLLVGGVGMYFLLIRFGVSKFAALSGGLFWMFSSPVFAWLQFQFIVVIVAYLPIAFICVDRLIKNGNSVKNYLYFSIVVALLISGSNIQFSTMALIPIFAYLYMGLLPKEIVKNFNFSKLYLKTVLIAAIKALKVTSLALLATITLSAVFILPVYLESRNLGRQPIPYSLFVSDATTIGILEFFKLSVVHLPLPFMSEQIGIIMYMGVIIMSFASIGILTNGKGRNFFRYTLLTVFLTVLGTPVAHIFYKFVPGINFMQQIGRSLFLVAFALSILATFGIDTLLIFFKKYIKKMKNLNIAGMLMPSILFVLVFVAVYQQVNYGMKLNPKTIPRQDKYLFPKTPVIDYLQENLTSDDRIVPLLNTWSGPVAPTMFTSQQMLYGIPSIAGYDSIISEYTLQAMRISQGESIDLVKNENPKGAFYNAYTPNATRWDLLSEFGVTYILAPPDIDEFPEWKSSILNVNIKIEEKYRGIDGVVYKMQSQGSRLFAIEEVKDAGKYDLDANFKDPKFTVIDNQNNSKRISEQESEHSDEINRLKTNNPNHIKYSFESTESSWLFIPTTYNKGWSGKINGKSTEIFRANHSFMSIEIPKGKVDIKLVYSPEGFRFSFMITISSLIILLILTLYQFKFKKKMKYEN